jgi:hypothetical protein
MRKVLKDLIASFTTDTLGFSARKLSAFAGVVVAIAVTYKLPKDAYLHAIYAWQTFALLCLGIVTIEQIIRLKNGGDNPPQTGA